MGLSLSNKDYSLINIISKNKKRIIFSEGLKGVLNEITEMQAPTYSSGGHLIATNVREESNNAK